MLVSYNKLWKLLIDLKMSQAELRKRTGLSSGTMTKLRRDEDVSLDALKKICDVCRCNIGDIIDVYKENPAGKIAGKDTLMDNKQRQLDSEIAGTIGTLSANGSWKKD